MFIETRYKYTLNSTISTSLMSRLLLYPETLGSGCSQFKSLSPYRHITFQHIMGFDNIINHQGIQTTRLHASRYHHCNYCHYCEADYVLFHNATCYINSLLSRMHVNTTKFLNITCTLVATSVRLWSFRVRFLMY